MTKTKKNKSILKRILAFLGAGVCALVCMLTMGYSPNITAYARDFDEYYSYNSIEHNVKISNNGSFGKNLCCLKNESATVAGVTMIYDSINQTMELNGTSTGDINIMPNIRNILPIISNSLGKTYSFTILKESGNFSENFGVYLGSLDSDIWSDRFALWSNKTDTSSSITFTVSTNHTYDTLFVYLLKGTIINNLKLKVQIEENSVATSYTPYQQNDFISFTNTLNVGIDKDSSAWLLEQCVFNNLRTSNNNYYMKSSIEDSSLQNVIYYTSNNIKGNFMFKDFFRYKDNVIDENNYFRIFVNFDYIESSDYDSTTYFNGNVQKIIYGSHKNWETYKSLQVKEKPSDWGTQYAKFNFISYVDNNGNNCNIYFPLISNNDNDYYEFRTLFVNTNGLTDYSDGYNTGYMYGKNDGYANGEKTGYQNGYKKGRTDGYNSGYSHGINESNDYTFLGLISACIDAPITYFTSLFNFELLGVNLSAFLTGLFTLCVIVTIVKLCLGGK